MGRRALALTRVVPAQRAYRLLLRLLALPLLLWLWWRGRNEPAYRGRLGERLGFIDPEPASTDGILIQAASVGEVQAVRPLIEALQGRWPLHAVTVSTQTPTGAATLQSHWGQRVQHLFAPLDTPGACARFLDRLQPRLLVLVERELWPELLLQCRARAIPVVLVNARLSERSARGYRRWRALMQPVWSQLTVVGAADVPSLDRLRALGVPNERLVHTGNLKFDVPDPTSHTSMPAWTDAGPVVVAGSTHEAEEVQLLDAWPRFAARQPSAVLVLVPRHPQRFEAVSNMLAQRGIAHARRSRGEQPDAQRRVLLGDTMGELTHWYRQATVCFIGGSLQSIGGHNALEAMAEGKPVLFGPHTRNFETLYQQVLEVDAGQMVSSGAELFEVIEDWLQHPEDIQSRGERALRFVQAQRGASARTLSAWDRLLPADLLTTPPAPVNRFQTGGQTIWFASHRLPSVEPHDFDPEQAQAQAIATGSGRGQVMKVRLHGVHAVLRHYRRGGLMARLSPDRYWGWRIPGSRAMVEYSLLRWMAARGLPVPTPLAARRIGQGPRYQADMLVEWVPGTRNLAQVLDVREVSSAEWSALGRAIRVLHDHQIFHSDLNCHNLLLDDNGEVTVIDFDKCQRRPGQDWKAANLERLLRSLRKESGRRPGFHWRDEAWPGLIQAYSSPG
ncbi:MAG: 3-deoxy-D-manno-octulosonic acid kinase [Burkholderiales bacterium]|nr:MAG: 3-deoxy-D-manno-octulosonic acid kinase [Burkholderiales bacterium]